MSDRMECTGIQQVISAAFDGDIPDPGALEAAKAHCRSCSRCAAFVGLLAEIKRLPAPELPAGVLERTLTAVGSEIDAAGPAEEDARSAESADGPGSPDATAGTDHSGRERPDGAKSTGPSQSPAPHIPDAPADVARERWRSWAPWAAAAAVFFAAAGVVTAQGVRTLLSPAPDTRTVSQTVTSQELGSAPEDTATHPEAPGTDTAEDESTDAPLSIAGPAYVTLSNEVYEYDAPADPPPDASPTGTLTSTLGTGAAATQREVFEGPESDTIIVAGEDDAFLRFTAVDRTYRGQRYTLRSSAITTFGEWPTLPAGVPRPSSPEGVPELVPAGADDSGVQIFVPPGTDPISGFAVAPDTSPTDPARGNPEWTWWEPAR